MRRTPGAPDPAEAALDALLPEWQALADNPELARLAAATDPTDVARVAALRRGRSASEVAVALSLADGRRRLRRKFPDLPARWDLLWTDREAAEQATSEAVATWKAARFGAVGGSVADLCCGMGGDTIALARVAETVAVDRSSVRAWMAARNAGCAVRVEDVRSERPATRLLHIDPARRDEASGDRRWRPEGFSPPLEACLRMANEAEGGALKLGPGLDPRVVERAGHELEFLSDQGTLVQAVCWVGVLATDPGFRRATSLPGGHTIVGRPGRPRVSAQDRFERWLYVADPALERAGLLASVAEPLGLTERWPGLGLLTSDDDVTSPWITGYEVLARPRAREADIRAALRAAGARGVRVRTRGKAADADHWTKLLRSDEGRAELDLFLLRTGDRLEAILARPQLTRASDSPDDADDHGKQN